ncbi:MAG: peptidoglycan-binding protein [Alphaproteobacteria bacterium]|nr:peptidoglycan-binding protein [Alphaproteobacteria bacterium]
MKTRLISAAALSAALLVSGTGQVAADAGDALVGGIIGGVIGGAIVNENNKRRTTTKRVYRAPVYSAQRAENREVQTSLNYFGFPAGTPDGVLGRRSRAAISQYQAHLGYPVTGYLTEYEKNFLLSSHSRALAGGYATNQQIASHPMGTRGLLLTYRDQAAGIAPQQQPGVVVVAPQVPVVPAEPQETQLVASTPIPEPVPESNSALPNFLGGGDGLSLASHCNTVSLLTNTNGGFTTLASMSDPNVVLNEQFCLARTYAIAQGEELASSIQGVGTAEIAAQCQSFGPVMKDHVAALSLKPRDEVLQGVSGFVLTTGMSPPQLAATSKICLSVGYRTDDLDVAIGSGLILVALGEQVYAELMGHHLSQGLGATQRTDLAGQWYQMSLAALDAGQPAVFAPGQPERNALIRAAATGEGQDAMNAPVQPASSLPNFSISK